MRRGFRKILFPPTNIPNVILFTVPNFYCNASSSSRVKERKTSSVRSKGQQSEHFLNNAKLPNFIIC